MFREDINYNILSEWRKKNKKYINANILHGKHEKKRQLNRNTIYKIQKKRKKKFMKAFLRITTNFKYIFRKLTKGGDADLELVDTLDPFHEGIKFSIRPVRKHWNNISNLSGGEKTLTSLSLIFSLHKFSPSPIYIMDEIDSALDFQNVRIISNYIKNQTLNSQFLIVSLRNQMFELANHLIGVYKTNDVTKTLAIDPKLFEIIAKNMLNYK